MQVLLDKLETVERAYSANESRETYNVLRDAAKRLYKAIWDALVDGKVVTFTGESYFLTHKIKSAYTETICMSGDGWLWYVDGDRVVHNFCLSAADKVVVNDE